MVDAGLVNERYRLDTQLARGGMGEVWQAYDLTLRRTVAVKVLAVGTTSATERERFAREAQAAAQLSHPNVVAVYDYGAWNDRPYLVMELLQGQTLTRLLAERGPLPVEQVRDIGAQVCGALQAAHAAGVVHRDIKPSNLILTPDGLVKVVDFGIAGVVDDASTRLTQAGTIVGTAAYLAPERVEGGPADAASDLYALGCVLYELLCGSAPFTGGMTTMAYAHVHQQPEPPSVHRQDLPVDLEGLLLSLLAKDPRQRPTAADAQSELRAPATSVLPAGATYAAPLPPAERSPRPPEERNRTPLLAGTAAVLAALAVAGLLLWYVANEPSKQADPQRTGAPVETTQPPRKQAIPSPTPTAKPSPTRSWQRPAFASRAWFEALDRQLARLTPGGNIDAEVYEKLTELTGKGLEAYDDGKPQRARRYAWDLVKAMGEARKDGKVVTSAGLLQDLLDRIGKRPNNQDGDRDGDEKNRDGD